jgi:hypothetical protein
MKPLGMSGWIRPGPVPTGVLAMASSSLPAKEGAASTNMTTMARIASSPMINKPFLLIKTSWKK